MVYSSDRTITQLNELASGNIDVNNDEIPIWDPNAPAGQRTMKTRVVSLLSRTTTSMISGLDASIAARLQVFGTPANGQIPKWNTANNRAEWAADATGAGSPDWANPGAIGSTTPNTGAFTTLTATGSITTSGGNINFTSGTAVGGTFNGTAYILNGAGTANRDFTVQANGVGRWTTRVNTNDDWQIISRNDDGSVRDSPIFVPRATNGAILLNRSINFPSLSTPATPTNGFSLFSNASNHFVWRNPNGFLISLIGTANTADRAYTLPNQSGTIALQENTISVFGTPANGQVPKWNSTNNRAEWAVDATGGSGSPDWGSPGAIGSVAPNTGAFTALTSGTYTLGTDLNILPVSGGQSLISSWWGLQIGGLKSDLLTGGTPANVGSANEFCVVVAPGATQAGFPNSFTTLGVVQRAWQTGGFLQRWISSGGGDVASVDLTGRIVAGSLQSAGGATFVSQGVTPTTPASGFTLYADSSSRMAWVGTNGFIRAFDTQSITANRTWTFPNQSGTIALQENTVSVFGTPANNQVVKWNTANNRAEWQADATSGGVTVYNYVQQAVPSSPADDERWLELDSNGVPVEAWFYDLANTRWLSINRYTNGTTLTSVSASTTNRFNFGAPGFSQHTGLLLIRVVHRVESTANHSAGSFYAIVMGVTNLTGTAAISGAPTFNTQALVSSATSTFAQNTEIVVPSGHNFAVSYNRTGTPANIWATTETTVRIIR